MSGGGTLLSGRRAADVGYHPNRGMWCLETDYELYDAKRGRWIRIGAGFEYNGASVPRVLWFAMGPHELGLTSTLIHDFLYSALPEAYGYTRAEADELFMELMIEEGVVGWRRDLAYAGVRALGGRRYRRGA